jgi:hypothetical protein
MVTTTEQPSMKFCKDCAHFRAPLPNLDIGEYAHCLFGMQVNPVTGATDLPTQSSRYCLNVRKSAKSEDCGTDAKMFRPKHLMPVESFQRPDTTPALLRTQV